MGWLIEEIFCFNVCCGLFGLGLIEEVIECCFNYLCSGCLYMCESEKDDGIVLEICGNLLFDGGFVISYVDIISYKNIVCELCLFVDVLEYCVVECICDFDEVWCEVECVNCYKLCFVVLVVYDLL